MSEKTFTSISEDQAVIQQLFWDDGIDSLNVIHEINLEAGIDARLAIRYQYKEGDPDYKLKCGEYGLNLKKGFIISEYVYDEFNTDRDYRALATFPGIESFYVLAELPHCAAVILNRLGGTTSKTSGQALPST